MKMIGALWFKSTEFGDDKDRVVRKSSGEWTYVAADIAYLNKIKRGFDHLIMVLAMIIIVMRCASKFCQALGLGSHI